MIIKLRKQITVNNKPISELNFDTEKITPQILIDASAAVNDRPLMVLPEFDRKYLITVAALLTGLPVDVLMTLHVKDFMQICNEIRNFLLDTESQVTGQNSNGTSES